MYPRSPSVHDTPKKQVHTVSLAQAKAAVNSPGAVHLLPEELRAQTLGKPMSPLGKSRSFEPIVRVDTLKFFDQATPPELPEPPTLVDAQGRHRSLLGHGKGTNAGLGYPFPVLHAPPLPSPTTLQRVKDQEMQRIALEAQPWQASKVKAAESLGLGDGEEPRGRTRQRGPRSLDYGHYMPQGKRDASSPSPDEETNDAQKVASEYHNVLSGQYRQSSSSSAYNSDDSIRAHMKMVPQPLFKNKPAAKLPGSMGGRGSDRGSDASGSPFHLRADSGASSQASGTSQGSFPLRLSLTPGSIHRRTSTSGSIPISPPTNLSSRSPAPLRRPAGSPEGAKKPKPRRKSRDDRVSMFYPYVGPRKGKKAKDKKATKETERPVPAMRLPSADIIAQRLRTPDGSTESSPLRSTASISTKGNTSNARKNSNASSSRQRTPLFQRLAGNAVKYADLITRPSEVNSHQSKPSDLTTASTHSPHLLPSPGKSDPPPVHLGWSDSAKSKFDRSRSSWQSASPQTPQFTHFTNLPARPLDESGIGLRESESPVRKGSIFGGLLDGWKERKKEERREELKKIIRVVPQGPPARMRTMDIIPQGQGLVRQASESMAAPAQSSRPMSGGLTRQASMGTATGQSGRPMSGGLARRMSAFGWM